MRSPICPSCNSYVPPYCWDQEIEIWECEQCEECLMNGDIEEWTFTLPHFEEWSSQLELEDGGNFILDPWERDFIEDMFTGIPEIWAVVPEESGKSTLISVVALYHARFREQGYVPIAASAQEQSLVLYRQAEGFVRRTQVMDQEFERRPGIREIRCDYTGSLIKAKAADERTGDGIIPTLAICDELHRHRDMGLYRTWRGKLTKRRNSQIVVISTAGEPGSDFEEVREKMRQHPDATRDGCFTRVATKNFILHDYAVPEEADATDIKVVKSANPSTRITEETLREKFNSPAMTLSHWRRFVCNLPTRSDMAAISEAEWYQAVGAEIPPGETIWLGLDCGWRWDTTAAVPFYMPSSGDRRFGPAEILIPPRDGTSLEIDRVTDMLGRIHLRNPVHTLVMDISDARDVADWAEKELGAQVVERGTSLPAQVEDYKNFMQALRNGQLKHAGDPGLSKHALNAVNRILPGGDAVFSRPAQNRRAAAQDRRVIDALTAAAAVHTVATADQQGSVYDERGVIRV